MNNLVFDEATRVTADAGIDTDARRGSLRWYNQHPFTEYQAVCGCPEVTAGLIFSRGVFRYSVWLRMALSRAVRCCVQPICLLDKGNILDTSVSFSHFFTTRTSLRVHRATGRLKVLAWARRSL